MLPDHEGIYHANKANEPPWYGSRRVENRALDSQDFTKWARSNGVYVDNLPDPNGGNTAFSLEATANNGTVYQPITTEVGESNINSFYIRGINVNGQIRIYEPDGSYTDVASEITSEWKRFSVSSITTATSHLLRIIVNLLGDKVEIAFGMNENSSGRSDTTTPSAYIPTTTAPVTRHYSNLNGRTVTDNVVDESVLGAPLPIAPSFYAAPEMRNEITWSRDLTNAAWQKYGSVGTSYDQIGITGEPNTATLLVGDGGVDRGVAAYLSKVSGEKAAGRGWMRKTGTGAANVGLWFNNNTNQRYQVRLNKVTGVLTETNVDTTVQASSVSDGGDWWIVEISAEDDWASTSVTLVAFVGLDNAGSPIVEDSTIGQCETHLNKTIAEVRGSAPIITEGAAVTQAAIQLDYDTANNNDTEGAYYAEIYIESGNTSGLIDGFLNADTTNIIADDGTNQESINQS